MNKCTFLFFYYRVLCFAAFAENPTSFESCQTPQNKIGQCIPIRSCPSLVSLLQQTTRTQEHINYLQQSQCGFENLQPKVCCALEDNGSKSATIEVDSKLLPSNTQCGISKASRIMGGELAGLNEHPWMALLEYDTTTGREFRCGGSLINNRYVLTAAHCIRSNLVSVRLGEYDLDTEEDCEGDEPGLEDCADNPMDIGIEEQIVYERRQPNFNSQYHDIALLRLNKAVTFSDWVRPICLPVSKEFRDRNFVGATMTAAGWGRTENSSQSHIKLKVELPVKSGDICLSRYSKRAGFKSIENLLCAGGVSGKDSCTGDSGGPLMFFKRTLTEDNWYAVGVVSFGPPICGTENWPSVYTKIVSYMPWIMSQLKP